MSYYQKFVAAPRVTAPYTALQNKPVVASFEAKRIAKPDRVMDIRRGRFLRDSSGNTRQEFLDGSSVVIAWLWFPADRRSEVIWYSAEAASSRVLHERYVWTDWRPVWIPVGELNFEPTSDTDIQFGLPVQRVLLTGPALTKSECWISAQWGLVISDLLETPRERSMWSVTDIQLVEPDPTLFRIPEGFRLE